MLYKTVELPEIKVGQLLSTSPPAKETILIIAIDSGPDGYVINVLIKDGQNINGVDRILAPVKWDILKPILNEVIDDQIDVSDHLESYLDWKEIAQEGKAGYWTCLPSEIMATIREKIDADN